MPPLELLAQVAPVDGITAVLLRDGVRGVAELVLGLVVVALWRDNLALRRERVEAAERLQAQRVTDAQAVTTKLVEVNGACVTALTNAARALEASEASHDRLGDAFRDLADECRKGGRK